jgi:hypothetical protein
MSLTLPNSLNASFREARPISEDIGSTHSEEDARYVNGERSYLSPAD